MRIGVGLGTSEQGGLGPLMADRPHLPGIFCPSQNGSWYEQVTEGEI